MEVNMSSTDRVIRIIVGVLAIVLGIYFKSWWGLVGVVPLLTALLNFCPAYNLIGISTSKKVKTEKLKS